MFRELIRRRIIAVLVGCISLAAASLFAVVPANAQARSAVSAKPSIAQLEALQSNLDQYAGTEATVGLSWGVDPATRTVVISVPKDDNDAATRAFLRRARQMNDNIRIERVARAPRLFLGPGDAIYTGGGRCSAALIATDGVSNYVVTAGHCTNIGTSWTTGSGATIGTTYLSSFPGNDYGFIRVTNPSLPLTNGSITTIGNPPANSSVQKVGSTTGLTSGTLIGYGRTVNYAEGTVFDLIETNVCVQPGDSGGLLFQGNMGIGITSGGTVGGCGPGFQSFFQPLSELFGSAASSAQKAGPQLHLVK